MINYFELLKNIPPQVATMIIAMLPIAENRVSVPIALSVYHLPLWQALFFSILGSILAAAIIVYGLNLIYSRLRGKMGIADKLMQKIFDRTERKFAKKYEKWGELALLIFVAVPLPLTGVWTGSLASFLFGIKPGRALLFISLGVILSAGIVALTSLGVINIFNF